MKKNQLKVIGAVILGLIGATLISIYWNHRWQEHDNDICIGAILFLTGPQSATGEELINGLLIAQDEINANGGIRGRNVRLLIEDSKDSPKDAIMAYRKLNKKNISALICSGDVIASTLVPIVDKDKVPYFATAAADTNVPLLSDWCFRVWEPEHALAKSIAHYAGEKMGLKSVAIITINNEYGDVSVQCFSDEFSKYGKILRVERYNISDANVRNQVAKCMEENPDGVFITGFGDGFGVCINQLKQAGYKGKVLSNSCMSMQYFQRQTWNAHEDIVFPSTIFSLISSNPDVSKFYEKYELKTGKIPSYTAAFGYEALNLIARAAERGDTTRNGIRGGMLSLGNVPSLLGMINYDESGEIHLDLKILQMKNHVPCVAP